MTAWIVVVALALVIVGGVIVACKGDDEGY